MPGVVRAARRAGLHVRFHLRFLLGGHLRRLLPLLRHGERGERDDGGGHQQSSGDSAAHDPSFTGTWSGGTRGTQDQHISGSDGRRATSPGSATRLDERRQPRGARFTGVSPPAPRSGIQAGPGETTRCRITWASLHDRFAGGSEKRVPALRTHKDSPRHDDHSLTCLPAGVLSTHAEVRRRSCDRRAEPAHSQGVCASSRPSRRGCFSPRSRLKGLAIDMSPQSGLSA
jgi:hypothetical protein